MTASDQSDGEEVSLVEDEEQEQGRAGFFACYLLCSENPRYKGRSYIGFTVNPSRRLRQHNGQLKQGAWLTKKYRPWDMVLCVHGFLSQVDALQFEWAWQHPLKSLAVRQAAANLQMRAVRGKVLLVFTMLTCPKWQSMDLSLQFFSTKYAHLQNGCPPLPPQMRVSVAPMDALPCYETTAPDAHELDSSTSLHDAEAEIRDAQVSLLRQRVAGFESSWCSGKPRCRDDDVEEKSSPEAPLKQDLCMGGSSCLSHCSDDDVEENTAPASPRCRRSPLGEESKKSCSKLGEEANNSPAKLDLEAVRPNRSRRQRHNVAPCSTDWPAAGSPRFFSHPPVVYIDESPIPVRKEVILIEASPPLPVRRDIIVLDDSPI